MKMGIFISSPSWYSQNTDLCGYPSYLEIWKKNTYMNKLLIESLQTEWMHRPLWISNVYTRLHQLFLLSGLMTVSSLMAKSSDLKCQWSLFFVVSCPPPNPTPHPPHTHTYPTPFLPHSHTQRQKQDLNFWQNCPWRQCKETLALFFREKQDKTSSSDF